MCCFPLQSVHVLFFRSYWHSLQNSLQEFLLVGDFSLNRPVSTELYPSDPTLHASGLTMTTPKLETDSTFCVVTFLSSSSQNLCLDQTKSFCKHIIMSSANMRPAVKEGLLVLNSLLQRLS